MKTSFLVRALSERLSSQELPATVAIAIAEAIASLVAAEPANAELDNWREVIAMADSAAVMGGSVASLSEHLSQLSGRDEQELICWIARRVDGSDRSPTARRFTQALMGDALGLPLDDMAAGA